MTNSYGDHLETEQKYDAGADFALPELGRLPGLSGRRPLSKRHYLSATYFDTEDFDLNQHRITLRRRVGGTDEGWHLKLPVRKDTRQELHAPLDDGPDGVVPARLAARVQDITAGRRLHPIAILDTERTVVTLTGKSGEPLVEVADDRVTATQFGRTGEEPMTWREIEVEVVAEGQEEEKQASQLLEEVGRVLREAGAARSSSGSKLGRLLQSLLIASPEVPDTLLALAGNVRGDLRSCVGILGTESMAPTTITSEPEDYGEQHSAGRRHPGAGAGRRRRAQPGRAAGQRAAVRGLERADRGYRCRRGADGARVPS